jgi:hypothetical protein
LRIREAQQHTDPDPQPTLLLGCFRFTILHSHGNAVDLGQMSSFYLGLGSRINCNIFSYDYSGYGASSGCASTLRSGEPDLAMFGSFRWVRIRIPSVKVLRFTGYNKIRNNVFVVKDCLTPIIFRKG